MNTPDPTAGTLPDRIDALLPQTQCRQCGYPGCRPYAEAISQGAADINRCPPGGDDTIRALARLTGIQAKPLDPACGSPEPPAIAVIDEALCIGCTMCVDACPVDAIVGAAKLMHAVIASECTGCRLCIPPCPVDCIAMAETGADMAPDERLRRAPRYRERHDAKNARLLREQAERHASRRESASERRKRVAVERAMQRARQRLQARGREK